jgi:hypothetical protein
MAVMAPQVLLSQQLLVEHLEVVVEVGTVTIYLDLPVHDQAVAAVAAVVVRVIVVAMDLQELFTEVVVVVVVEVTAQVMRTSQTRGLVVLVFLESSQLATRQSLLKQLP